MSAASAIRGCWRQEPPGEVIVLVDNGKPTSARAVVEMARDGAQKILVPATTLPRGAPDPAMIAGIPTATRIG